MKQLAARTLLCAVICVAATAIAQDRDRKTLKPPATSSDREGLTEPFRRIDLAAAETGLILQIDVEDGQTVQKGQVLARLDDLVLQASLKVAEAQKDSVGQLRTAEAELKLRTSRHSKLAALLESGHATDEEVKLAESEKEVAEAKVLQAREALRVRTLEYERTLAQIERRLIRSPVDGIVTTVYREPYEFVSYTDPVVMTVVQLDPIVAVFTFYPEETKSLKVGQQVNVNLASNPQPARGIVSYISPVLDAESGTVKVKVKIDNRNGKYRSGDKCTLGASERPQLGSANSHVKRRKK